MLIISGFFELIFGCPANIIVSTSFKPIIIDSATTFQTTHILGNTFRRNMNVARVAARHLRAIARTRKVTGGHSVGDMAYGGLSVGPNAVSTTLYVNERSVAGGTLARAHSRTRTIMVILNSKSLFAR